MHSKTIFIFCALIVFYISFHTVNGKPNLKSELIDTYLSRTKRHFGTGRISSMMRAVESITKCANEGGCHTGYCWTRCSLSTELTFGEWCYTTKTQSQNYNYVRCNKDSDCSTCWKCAGPCTIFWIRNIHHLRINICQCFHYYRAS